jgi:hypothetical protein
VKLFVPYWRATLLIPSGPAHDPDQKHLFVVLTDPVEVLEFAGKHSLLVGIASIYPDVPHDPACELHAGDHEFIRHKSYIAYAHARIEPSQKLVNGVKSGDLVPKTMLAQEIFARVCKALAESRFAAPRMLAFYRAAGEARNNPD